MTTRVQKVFTFYDFLTLLALKWLIKAISRPKARKPPGGNIIINMPSAPPMRLWPKKQPVPSSSRTIPTRVSAQVKPRPMNRPSRNDMQTLFFEATASARPRTMQVPTIRAMKRPRLSYSAGR